MEKEFFLSIWYVCSQGIAGADVLKSLTEKRKLKTSVLSFWYVCSQGIVGADVL